MKKSRAVTRLGTALGNAAMQARRYNEPYYVRVIRRAPPHPTEYVWMSETYAQHYSEAVRKQDFLYKITPMEALATVDGENGNAGT